ncbi:MAG TPA: glycosyltransferase family 2 protein [Pyrinomonadaceae bacterium]
MKAELSFIIVNWNGGELLSRCVESIVESPPGVPYEVVVIDNASSDESLSRLRASSAAAALGETGLRIVENTDNLGFGGANNQAFALTEAPLLFLLNPDTRVTAGAVDRLIKTVRSEERVGGCGPRLVNEDGSLQVSVWRNPPTVWAQLVEGFQLHRLMPRRMRGELLLAEHWEHNRRRRVNMLSGAAILVRREVIKEVGGFDERFHMYGEDNEWCLRIVRAGWTLMFEPESVVVHHGAKSSMKRWDSLEKREVQANAHLRSLLYTLPRWRVVANLSTSYFLLSLQKVSRKLRGRDASEVEVTRKVYAAGLKRALRDGPD